jgi:3-oxoacyl-[acyl-carrier-protein] synthase III
MSTDSVAVLKHGVQLGARTFGLFRQHLGWQTDEIDRVVCHQVGSGHQEAILKTLQIPKDKDFTTYRFLGNMGTAALPVTAAIAEERGILKPGQRTAWLGIGSGLTCLMAGLEW